MRFASGSRLGPYEIASALGAGGMGEVYRAHDPRLGRDVAIKVLPAERMADETRRRRFVQEARAASALNHPNIVTIHEIESSDGIDFIVMEYVPGQALDGLIPKGGMRLGDALRIAVPVADALAAAHAKGIVHRDVKPANVVVTRDGVVKVLDFGLAKLVDVDSEDGAATRTSDGEDPLSRPGAITGTAAYMSPEQAAGGKVDTRSDVFSFGAVLYEMVTGRRAFAGRTLSETLAAVANDEPRSARELVPSVPETLERLILRCLRKEAERRVQYMLDVKVELQEIAHSSDSASALRVPNRRIRIGWAATALALLLTASGAAAWLWRSRAASLPPATVVPLTALPGGKFAPTFSPDGSQVAFSWNGEKRDNFDIYVQMVGATEARRLTTDPAPDTRTSWSPDGRQIAFVRVTGPGPRGTLHVVPPVAGAERKLTDEVVAGYPSWSPDSRWLATGAAGDHSQQPIGVTRGIRLFRASDGETRTITAPSGPDKHILPAFSPDGRHLAYASCRVITCWIDVIGLDADFVTRGAPRRLTRRVVAPTRLLWSSDGRSVMHDDAISRRLWRVGIDADTPPSRIEIAGFGGFGLTVALNGKRLAFVRSLTYPHIYRFQAGRAPDVVVASSFDDWAPALSPDGTRLAFASARGDLGGGAEEIWVAEADGANPTQLVPGHGRPQGSPSWSPDGRTIAFDSMEEDGRWHVWTVDARGGSPHRLTSNPESENLPGWSHDGRFIYFAYGPDNDRTIWRAPAAGGSTEQVTRAGGGSPQASPDGKTLYVKQQGLAGSPLFAVPLHGGPERSVADCVLSYAVTAAGVHYVACGASRAAPLLLWDPSTGKSRALGTLEGRLGSGITVSSDGRTILFTKQVGEGTDLMLIENFR